MDAQTIIVIAAAAISAVLLIKKYTRSAKGTGGCGCGCDGGCPAGQSNKCGDKK